MPVKCKVALFLILCCYVLTDCSMSKNTQNTNQDLTIKLRWVKSYPHETQEKVNEGLKWILSYLGALLPQETSEETMVWLDDNLLHLDISKAGFPKASYKEWNQILQQLRQTKEYTDLGSLDIGRFVMMSFNSSDSYYVITGVESTFDAFKKKYEFVGDRQEHLLPGQSGVTTGLRKIYSSTGNTIDRIAHMAEEGHGDDPQTFVAKETEVFDFMLNGQPRFAVYGKDGNLKTGGNPELSFAGKPSKCMWCHESGVNLPFRLMNTHPDKPELLSDFKNLVNSQNKILDDYYFNLTETIDTFRFQKPNHYLAELLYISYQTPTKQRALNEIYNAGKSDGVIDFEIVDSTHHEFKFLRKLVSRQELDEYLPYKSTLDIDARETYLEE